MTQENTIETTKETEISNSEVGPNKQSEYEIPSLLKRKYLSIEQSFYFRDKENALAFRDHGLRLITTYNDPDVAVSMVELAEAKSWRKILVRGHENFKREVWLQASLKGIEVKGYKPKEVDLAKLIELQESRSKKIKKGIQKSDLAANHSQPKNLMGIEEKDITLEGDYKIATSVMIDVLRKKGYSQTTIEKAVIEATKQLTEMREKGQQAPRVKIFDKNAPKEMTQEKVTLKSKERDIEKTIEHGS